MNKIVISSFLECTKKPINRFKFARVIAHPETLYCRVETAYGVDYFNNQPVYVLRNHIYLTILTNMGVTYYRVEAKFPDAAEMEITILKHRKKRAVVELETYMQHVETLKKRIAEYDAKLEEIKGA